ncbi:AGE family epimerase/isomerase [Salinispira pacifica]
MTPQRASELKKEYEEDLFERVIPFWERHSLDREQGGYFSCLERDGTVFDTDKFAWMQGREVWGFSRLCTLYGERMPERRPAWLDAARLGAQFLRAHGRAPNGDWYFALDRAGKPLVEPYNIFSDCFISLGLAEYFRASGEQWALDTALATYRRIGERLPRPKGAWTKQIGENRPLAAMALPMMQIWMAWELRGLLPESDAEHMIDENVDRIFRLHVDRELRTVFERVLPDGSHPESMDGRLLNPGHALEVLWFILRIAGERGDRRMIDDIVDIMLWCIERGWDEKYGGIFYYRDYRNFPTEKLESDMKLWWVHAEALCAFLLATRLTGSAEHERWFERIHEYTFARFPDREHGEWYGYLDRRGEVSQTLKGGKWKGFFHVPRALFTCIGWLSQMEGDHAAG